MTHESKQPMQKGIRLRVSNEPRGASGFNGASKRCRKCLPEVDEEVKPGDSASATGDVAHSSGHVKRNSFDAETSNI